MAIDPATAETAYDLAGNAEGPFATVFPYSAPDDVEVWLGIDAEMRLLVRGADYTITAATPLTAGGNVHLATGISGAGWPAHAKLALVRATPNGQPSRFGEVTGFSPKASEGALDNLARQIQDLRSRMSRTIRVRPGDPGTVLGSIAQRAEGVCYFDADGKMQVYPLAQILAEIGIIIENDPPHTSTDDGAWG